MKPTIFKDPVALKHTLNHLHTQKLVRFRDHPVFPLRVYSYTDTCQYGRHWDEVTLNTRSLVVSLDTWEVVSQSMPKFFNFGEEHAATLSPPWRVFEKVDGKLINIFNYKGDVLVSSRGSFDNQECFDAEKILKHSKEFQTIKNLVHSKPVTLCFEMIHPNHKIIIDYGNARELVYLCAVDQRTWSVYPKLFKDLLGGAVSLDMNSDTHSLNHIGSIDSNSMEGYVLHDEQGNMLKIKHDSYKKMARIQSGFNSKQLFKLWSDHIMGNNSDLNTMFLKIPDEFYPWASKMLNKWNQELSDKMDMVNQGLWEVRASLIDEGRFDDKSFARNNFEINGPGQPGTPDPNSVFMAKNLKMPSLLEGLLKSIAPEVAEPPIIFTENGK